MKNFIQIKPRRWEENGTKYYADCYPYINDNPVPSINSCENCVKDNPNEDYCDEWRDKVEEAPLFCGSICSKFELINSKRKFLEEAFGGK